MRVEHCGHDASTCFGVVATSLCVFSSARANTLRFSVADLEFEFKMQRDDDGYVADPTGEYDLIIMAPSIDFPW